MNYSYKNFKKKAIIRFLALDKYHYLIHKKNSSDIRKNKEYQKIFNKFFMVRRDEAWRKVFYDFFEENKNNSKIKFEDILIYLYKKTGNIEASFSSKMLAIINPNMPIWDQYVIQNFDIVIDGKSKQERLEKTIEGYKEILLIEKELLKREDIQRSIKEFKNEFKEYNLSDIKILDYIVWNDR